MSIRLCQTFLNVSKGSPFNFLIFCNKFSVQKIPKGPPFFDTETAANSEFSFFPKKFIVPKWYSFNFFDISHQIGFSKTPNTLFTVFGLVRIFPFLSSNFSGFLSTLKSNLVFLTGIFSMRRFSNLFLSKPLSICTRNETFCEHRGRGRRRVLALSTYRRLHKKLKKFL